MNTITPATDQEAFVADLLLVRYGCADATPKKIRDDLGKLLPGPLNANEFELLRTQLADADYLTINKRKKYQISDRGRAKALRFLGLAEWPNKLNWSMVLKNHLFPMAINGEATTLSKFKSGAQLAAYVLKRQYDLPSHAGDTPAKVMEALACKLLGHPEQTTLTELLVVVLNTHMKSDERLSKADLAKQLPLFGTGLNSTNADDIRRHLVRDWLTKRHAKPTPPTHTEPFDLPSFANTVLKLARLSPPDDRFYDNKVFIAPLWRTSQREPNFPTLTLAEFKRHLVEANTKNLLPLSRADLVSAMDPVLVAESETIHLGAMFHFVLLEEPRR